MHVMLVKTTSLGDLVHTLPALTDAAKHIPNLTVDWVAEQPFSQVPTWHPAVRYVIPCRFRHWRKHPIDAWRSKEWHRFIGQMRYQQYDKVIDAQGLLKSGVISRFARGKRFGLDSSSAREPVAQALYDVKVNVSWDHHAIDRTRILFAKIFGYPEPDTPLDYGLKKNLPPTGIQLPANTLLACHGTTWDSKHWPEAHWVELFKLAHQAHMTVALPWGNKLEKQRSEAWADQFPWVKVLPKMTLTDFLQVARQASIVVANDSGLSHISAASGTPTIGLYAATSDGRTGVRGQQVISLHAQFPCSPCYKRTCPLLNKKQTMPPCYKSLLPLDVFNVMMKHREVKMESMACAKAT